jgi:hypothetical protein
MAKNLDHRSKLLELLAENPSISAVCRKIGINRMRFYRLKKDDADFRAKVKLAMIDGRSQWIEIAELGLMKKVREGDLGAIKYFLSNNDPRYMPKSPIDPLSPEDREEWARKKKESVPTYNLTEAQTETMKRSFRTFGFTNEDGSFSDDFIKRNPELIMGWIREDEALRRKSKGLPG